MPDFVNMKAVFEALLPDGSVWQPRIDGDFDKLLSGIGLNAEAMREFLELLSTIRDPYKTEVLSDLEKEYGRVTNPQLSESDRRKQLAAIKYAKRRKGTFDELEKSLNDAGFDVCVVPNDPAIDPNDILQRSFSTWCNGDNAYAGYESIAGTVEAICCQQGGELIVNGNLYSQEYGYLLACDSDSAFAGYDTALAGFFEFDSMIKTLIEYSISSEKATWPRVFFICKSVSQYERLVDWNMEYSGISHWTLDPATVANKETFDLKDAYMELPEIKFWTAFNNADLSKVASSLDYSTQALRIKYDGTDLPAALQDHVLLKGCEYNIKGYARGDGVAAPKIWSYTGMIWTGTSSSDWQYFDVDFTHTDDTSVIFFSTGALGDHWIEYDKIILTNKDSRGNRIIKIIADATLGFGGVVQRLQIDHAFTLRALAWSDGIAIPGISYQRLDGAWTVAWLGSNSKSKQVVNVNIPLGMQAISLAATTISTANHVMFDHVEIHDPLFERAQIPNNRREVLRHLVLKSKPLHSWGLLIADYV